MLFSFNFNALIWRCDRRWSTGEGNGKPLQYSCLENPMNIMKRQNARILREELPRSVGAQYATGSLQSKGLSRVFSNTTVQKHQFFGAQLSL